MSSPETRHQPDPFSTAILREQTDKCCLAQETGIGQHALGGAADSSQPFIQTQGLSIQSNPDKTMPISKVLVVTRSRKGQPEEAPEEASSDDAQEGEPPVATRLRSAAHRQTSNQVLQPSPAQPEFPKGKERLGAAGDPPNPRMPGPEASPSPSKLPVQGEPVFDDLREHTRDEHREHLQGFDPLEGDVGMEWFMEPVPAKTQLVIGLKEAQWAEVLRNGFLSNMEGKILCHDLDQATPPSCDILVILDVALCQMEGINFYRDPVNNSIFSYGVTTRGVLPPKYIGAAIDFRTKMQIYPEIGVGNDLWEPEGFPKESQMEEGWHEDPTPPQSGEGEAYEQAQFLAPQPTQLVVSQSNHQIKFRFQSELPPEQRAAYLRARGGGGPQRPTPYRIVQGDVAPSSSSAAQPSMHVLDEDWVNDYTNSACFKESWVATQDTSGEVPWPPGVHIWGNKMYWGEKLCIPEDKCVAVTAAYHQLWGHIGTHRMTQEIRRKCEFPSGVAIDATVKRVKQGCQVCQQTEPPNWQVARKQNMTPVPNRIFSACALPYGQCLVPHGVGKNMTPWSYVLTG
jgi:hypothetical protein